MDKRWRLRVYNQASTSLSTGNVYWQTTCLAAPVTVRGPLVRPTLGRAESQPWTLDILDDGSSVTSHLSDSSGRLFLLGRIASVERSLGGAAFAVHGAGRISDVLLTANIGIYQLVVEDERRIERNATIFNTTNTTRLYPAGPGIRYGFWPAVPSGTLTAITRNGKAVLVTFEQNSLSAIADVAVQAIRDNLGVAPLTVPSSKGNFANLRCRIGSRDLGIISFGTVHVADQPSQSWFQDLDNYAQSPQRGYGIKCWVWATTSQLSVGTKYSSAFLHMYSAPPSLATPLHVGSSLGVTPPQMLKNVYNGQYSSAGSPKVRYSTAAFDVLGRQSWPLVRFRITGRANMADWLEQNIYRPFLLAPLVDSQGRVVPTSLKLPNSTTGITWTFNASNLREPYPTWQHLGREQVTRLRIVAEAEWAGPGIGRSIVGPAPTTSGTFPGFQGQPGGDLMLTAPSTYILDHDRITQFGIKELVLESRGVHPTNAVQQQDSQVLPPSWDGSGVGGFQIFPAVTQYLSWLKRDFFDRYGDGPIMGKFSALSTAEGQNAGTYVKLALGTFPNPSLQSRGGTRVIQLLSRDDMPEGPEFTYLDAGNSLAGLAAPTLTLSTSTADRKHSLVATVGAVPAAGGYRLEINGSTSSPSSASAFWTPVLTVTATAGAQRLGNLPAGKKFWLRAQNQQANRIRSSWTLSTGKTTGAITAPSSFASTSITSNSVGLKWAPGDVDEMTDLHVNTSTGLTTFTSTNRTLRIATPNTKHITVTQLAAGTKYLFAVRHADPFGGYSTVAKLVATTLTTGVGGTNPPPVPLGITILVGR